MIHDLLLPAELRARLRIGKAQYRQLLADGCPHVIVSGRERRRRLFDLDRVLGWLEERAATPARRRGRPHARQGVQG